jgi:hypothetical protein
MTNKLWIITTSTNATVSENRIRLPVLAVDKPSSPASHLNSGNMMALNTMYATISASIAGKQPVAIFCILDDTYDLSVPGST